MQVLEELSILVHAAKPRRGMEEVCGVPRLVRRAWHPLNSPIGPVIEVWEVWEVTLRK